MNMMHARRLSLFWGALSFYIASCMSKVMFQPLPTKLGILAVAQIRIFIEKKHIYTYTYIRIYIYRVPGEPGAKVSMRKDPTSQTRNLPIECTQGDQSVPFLRLMLVCSNIPSGGVLLVASFGFMVVI